MSRDIAENLFIGIYTDTVEFRTPLTTPKTLLISAKLIENIPNFGDLITKMENSERKEHIKFVGQMLQSIETFLGEKMAVASVNYDDLVSNNISEQDVAGHSVTALMRTVEDWEVLVLLTEIKPNRVKISLRSKDAVKYDVSKLASQFGGGGHKGASGILMLMPLAEAKKQLVAKAEELFG
jgi:phosphoesterase RecJ-like protein